jgi:hypothetical protein
MRIWDIRTSTGVDCFIANSRFVAHGIMKMYRRVRRSSIHPSTSKASRSSNGKRAFMLRCRAYDSSVQ